VTIAAGVALSLASAWALNWGWVAQHGAARALPPLSVRAPLRSLRSLFGDLSWLAGFAVGIGGWALYVAALAVAPLSLVQATAAGGVGILALLAHRRGERISRRERRAVVGAVCGLALLGVSLAGGVGSARHAAVPDLVGWLVVAVAAAALAGSRATAAGLGVGAGVLYGAGDVATKAATFGGAWLALVAVVLAAHGAAFALLQLGFQRGRALTTAGTATLLTNALPITAGIVLFHEPLPANGLGALRVVAFVLVVASAALLTRGETTTPAACAGARPASSSSVEQATTHLGATLTDPY
jgi:hypothetical protein